MQASPSPTPFSQNSLILNFSLNLLTFKPNGIKCGKTAECRKQSFCFINKYDFILISTHEKTNELMIFQINLRIKNGQIVEYRNYQEFSFGPSDQIRVYKSVGLGKLGQGCKPLQEFMKVGERSNEDKGFFIKFDTHEKRWVGCWDRPVKNQYLKINKIIQFLAKLRKISFKQVEIKPQQARIYAFEWFLSPSSEQIQLLNQTEQGEIQQEDDQQKKEQINI